MQKTICILTSGVLLLVGTGAVSSPLATHASIPSVLFFDTSVARTCMRNIQW
jgi:hypothetical protein